MTPNHHVENVPRLDRLSDDDLLRQIESLMRAENAATIHILHHLNEIERRKLHLDLGYSSLFDYCIRSLEYSPSAAGRRIQAARCIRRYPTVLLLLRERELNLSTISLIEPILTIDNCAAILERVRGASYRDVERIASEYRPPVAFRDRVEPVRVAMPARVGMPAREDDDEAGREPEQTLLTPGAGSNTARIEQKLLVQFLAGEELMEKFEEARSLLSHRCPDGTFAEVFDVLLSEFLERHSPAARQKRREAKTGAESPDSRRRECAASTDRRSRHISADARDEVFVRDQGRCAFVARDGTPCGSTRGLQVDHIRPFAVGGSHDPSNLRLLCTAHNLRAAELTLGAEVMEPYWKRE